MLHAKYFCLFFCLRSSVSLDEQTYHWACLWSNNMCCIRHTVQTMPTTCSKLFTTWQLKSFKPYILVSVNNICILVYDRIYIQKKSPIYHRHIFLCAAKDIFHSIVT